jgi:hypothetical protein
MAPSLEQQRTSASEFYPSPQPRAFIIGLAIGAIPLAVGLIGVGLTMNSGLSGLNTALSFLFVAVFAYFIWWLGALGSLFSANSRRFALGMIAALLASPVIYYVSCQVLATIPRG